tara:strand:+ start:65 stop:2173 length:2109 start_codon:yes stop_codon:yes gene_type:complete
MRSMYPFLWKIKNYLSKKESGKKPLRIFMLSPADSAGSGARIRDAVRSVNRKVVINLVTWRRRNIGYGDADIVLSDGSNALKKAQRLLDLADIIHYKDDTPPIEGMYGLKMPQNIKIIHTAGGSGFRRLTYPNISNESILQEYDILLNSDWTFDNNIVLLNPNKKSLQINSLTYDGEEHIRIKSKLLENIKGPFVIKGKVNLIESKENSRFNICSVIVEHIDVRGKRIARTHKRFGALENIEMPWQLIFEPVNGQDSINIIFYKSFIEKVNVSFNNLRFMEMKPQWHVGNRPPFTNELIEKNLNLNLENIGNENSDWWIINPDKHILLSSTNKKIEMDTLGYSEDKHINIRSKKLLYDGHSHVIYGDVMLYQINNSNKVKIFTIIAEYMDKNGKVIDKIKRRFNAREEQSMPWFLSFNTHKKAHYIRFIFHFPGTEKSRFKIDNLHFIKMSKHWNKNIQYEKEHISMGLWPLKTYEDADLRTVLTPDLLINGEKIMYTPHAFPVTKSKFQENHNERLIVSHAPSNNSKKGTDSLILPALEKLSEKYDFEISLITGMSHQKCLDLIKKSDIFIDQVLVGFYGNAALEAMSYGIPTMTYLNEKYLNMIGTSNKKLPLINIPYQTEKAIVETLEIFLKYPNKLKKIANKTKKWVEVHHDYQSIGKLWIWNYENLFKPDVGLFKRLLNSIKSPFYKIGNFTLNKVK